MITIRPLHYTDLAALLQIANTSFADEYVAQGVTPAALAQQLRMTTRGRMIPLKVLSALAGIRWEMLVAEVDGQVVGCGGYFGRQQIELANLMVLPAYRRRGIGQALLVERLNRLKAQGYPLVTTTILAANEASLGNVRKQGFTAFDQYTMLEKALPLNDPSHTLTTRPIQAADLTTFQQMESQSIHAARLQIEGSAAPEYFPTLSNRLLNQLTGTQRWRAVSIHDGAVIGFTLTSTGKNQTKGLLARPITLPDHCDRLSAMVFAAASWLSQLGKATIRMAVSTEQTNLIEELRAAGWAKTQSWLRLVKWLQPETELQPQTPKISIH
ncbi:MAG: GNAT family N-acetyltransferase [Chloroflexi bacterium]|nr:GNAT family N-acetyltransferase [Chloroflexota bacterium]MCI0647581.1 GNAT family N-acetyltransferase [Chloroflexota bacterium]MCI0729114.1 GNAT family N-acetyltransferase [Chloroflexota bacterium]